MSKNAGRHLARFLSVVILLLSACDAAMMALTPWWLQTAYRRGYGWMGYYFGIQYGASHPGGTYYLMLTFILLCGVLILALLLEGFFILRSVIKGEPFCRRNAGCFRGAGALALGIAGLFLFKMTFSPSILTLLCIGVFVLFALFMFVLAQLFALAAQIKEENDMTI